MKITIIMTTGKWRQGDLQFEGKSSYTSGGGIGKNMPELLDGSGGG